MKVIRATALGLCFGVRDALAAVAAIDQPHEVTIHGELVHNESVQDELRRRGFVLNPETGRIGLPLTERVVITAHGISDRERARLLGAGKRLIDTTCPLVRRVHEAARDLERLGYFVVVLGRPDHVEVLGIVGDLERYAVVPDKAAVRNFDEPLIGVVSQSTMPPDLATHLIDAIERANPYAQVRVIDTICRPTRDRQEALRELLDRVEALVVVGGRHSNNTRQLARLAEERSVPVTQVTGPDDLDNAWLAQFRTVGLTAGTSTLDATVDAVERALLRVVPRSSILEGTVHDLAACSGRAASSVP